MRGEVSYHLGLWNFTCSVGKISQTLDICRTIENLKCFINLFAVNISTFFSVLRFLVFDTCFDNPLSGPFPTSLKNTHKKLFIFSVSCNSWRWPNKPKYIYIFSVSFLWYSSFPDKNLLMLLIISVQFCGTLPCIIL